MVRPTIQVVAWGLLAGVFMLLKGLIWPPLVDRIPIALAFGAYVSVLMNIPRNIADMNRLGRVRHWAAVLVCLVGMLLQLCFYFQGERLAIATASVVAAMILAIVLLIGEVRSNYAQ